MIETKFHVFIFLTHLSFIFFIIISITEEVNANDAYLRCGFILIELIYKNASIHDYLFFPCCFVVVVPRVDDLVVCVKSHYLSLDMIN